MLQMDFNFRGTFERALESNFTKALKTLVSFFFDEACAPAHLWLDAPALLDPEDLCGGPRLSLRHLDALDITKTAPSWRAATFAPIAASYSTVHSHLHALIVAEARAKTVAEYATAAGRNKIGRQLDVAASRPLTAVLRPAGALRGADRPTPGAAGGAHGLVRFQIKPPVGALEASARPAPPPPLCTGSRGKEDLR